MDRQEGSDFLSPGRAGEIALEVEKLAGLGSPAVKVGVIFDQERLKRETNQVETLPAKESWCAKVKGLFGVAVL